MNGLDLEGAVGEGLLQVRATVVHFHHVTVVAVIPVQDRCHHQELLLTLGVVGGQSVEVHPAPVHSLAVNLEMIAKKGIKLARSDRHDYWLLTQIKLLQQWNWKKAC